METWTWIDALVYFLCVFYSAAVSLTPLQWLIVAAKFTRFVAALPVYMAREFTVVSFRVRSSERPYTTFFEFGALLYTRWVLSTFRASVVSQVFFGDRHARTLYAWRKFKYGTENIGDFDYETVRTEKCRGYWLRSRSRRHQRPDLVLHFAPGALGGCGSVYLYLEYLSMLLVELQVHGFANPVVFCVDARCLEQPSYEAYVTKIVDAYKYAYMEFPHAKHLIMGSGLGGTAALSMLLRLAAGNSTTHPVLTSLELTNSLEANNRLKIDNRPGVTKRPKSIETMPLLRDCVQAEKPENLSLEVELSNEELPTHASNLFTNFSGVYPNTDSYVADLSNGVPLDPINFDTLPSVPSDISSSESDSPPPPAVTFTPDDLASPDAALFLSPLMRVNMDRIDSYPDFLSSRMLRELGVQLAGSSAEPGLVRDRQLWSAAVPRHGMFVMHGGAETCRREIEGLTDFLRVTHQCRIVTTSEGSEVHAWPITQAFLGRSTSSQMYGITRVAQHIANMLVMDCLFAHESDTP